MSQECFRTFIPYNGINLIISFPVSIKISFIPLPEHDIKNKLTFQVVFHSK